MLCRLVICAFILAYAAALAIFAAGIWGWFGVERDPLSAVYLLALGLPWNLALDLFPASLSVALVAATPMASLLILVALCHKFSTR